MGTSPRMVDHDQAPISAWEAARQSRQWAELRCRGDWQCWLEARPEEGRTLLLGRYRGGDPQVLTPAEFSVRSRVYEYGGGAYTLTGDAVVFVNEQDQDLYLLSLTGPAPARPLLPLEAARYGDLQYDAVRKRIIAIEEMHCEQGEPQHRIIAIGLEDGQRKVLAQGADFYASPRISPDGSRMAWLSWNHPHQPWRQTQLFEAQLNGSGLPVETTAITGDAHLGAEESVFQPEYSPEGTLYFVSDRQGWWNLYRHQRGEIQPLLTMEAEFGGAQWQLGGSCYQFIGPDLIGCTYLRDGYGHLALLNTQTGRMTKSPLDYCLYYSLAVHKDQLLCLALAEQTGCRLLALAPETGLVEQQAKLPDPAGLAVGSGAACRFPQGEETVHGIFYRPPTPRASGLPPLLVQVHGGPTSMASPAYDPLKQYWLQRGFALLDLNYRGSTGYGRRYRQRLQEAWGVLDVEDAIEGARYCARMGWVDAERLAIRGNSAGGYTVLRALSHPRSPFRAGASHYGISDLSRLNAETHKFESHYLSWLIGDEQKTPHRYHSRSPIYLPERLSCPVIFFQGEQDRVVPPSQTRALYDNLRVRGVATEYHGFKEERHGFRYAQTRARVLAAEYRFYEVHLGLVEAASTASR